MRDEIERNQSTRHHSPLRRRAKTLGMLVTAFGLLALGASCGNFDSQSSEAPPKISTDDGPDSTGNPDETPEEYITPECLGSSCDKVQESYYDVQPVDEEEPTLVEQLDVPAQSVCDRLDCGEGSSCDPELGRCVECRTDFECGGANVCDQTTYSCKCPSSTAAMCGDTCVSCPTGQNCCTPPLRDELEATVLDEGVTAASDDGTMYVADDDGQNLYVWKISPNGNINRSWLGETQDGGSGLNSAMDLAIREGKLYLTIWRSFDRGHGSLRVFTREKPGTYQELASPAEESKVGGSIEGRKVLETSIDAQGRLHVAFRNWAGEPVHAWGTGETDWKSEKLPALFDDSYDFVVRTGPNGELLVGSKHGFAVQQTDDQWKTTQRDPAAEGRLMSFDYALDGDGEVHRMFQGQIGKDDKGSVEWIYYGNTETGYGEMVYHEPEALGSYANLLVDTNGTASLVFASSDDHKLVRRIHNGGGNWTTSIVKNSASPLGPMSVTESSTGTPTVFYVADAPNDMGRLVKTQ